MYMLQYLTLCSSWDKEEGVLSLLLEYGETDLATIISNSGPSLPTALYFWNEMLRIMNVRTSFYFYFYAHLQHYCG